MAQETVDNIIGQAALDEIKAVLTGLDAIAAKQKEINDASRGASGGMNNAQNTRQLAAATTELERLQRRLAEATGANAQQAAEYRERLRQLALEQRNAAQSTLAAEGSLNALRAELVQLNRQFDNLSRTERENAAVGGVLTDRIQNLHREVSALEQATGRHQRNVGNYASAFNGLGNSINQLTREMPAFANSLQTGFLAISNNLPALFDELKKINAENAELRAGGNKTTPILKQLAASIFSWQTLLSVGVTLLTVYGAKLFETFDKGKEAADEFRESLADIDKQINKTAGEEIGKLRTLVTIAEDVTQSIDDRRRAAAELQKLYPTILGNLSQEAILQGNARVEIEKTTAAILAKARASAASEKIAKFEERALDLREQIAKKSQEVYDYQQAYQESRSQAAENDAEFWQQVGQNEGIKLRKQELASLYKDMSLLKDAKKWYVDYLGEQNAMSLGLFTADVTSDPKKPKATKAPKEPKEEKWKHYDVGLRIQPIEDIEADNKRIIAELEDFLAKRKKLYEGDMSAISSSRTAMEQREREELAKRYSDGLLNESEYRAQLAGVNDKYDLEELESLKARLFTEILWLGQHGEDTAELLRKYAELEKGIEKEKADTAIAQYERRAEAVKALHDKEKELAEEVFNLVVALATGKFDAENSRIDKQILNIEREKAAEVEQVNASVMSKADKEEKVAAIESKAQAKRLELEARQQENERKRAEVEKLAKAAQITANAVQAAFSLTAKASEASAQAALLAANPVTAAYAPIAAASAGAISAQIPIVAAIAAAQIAAIYAVKAYATGTDNHPGGDAIMGELGTELVIERSGKSWLTADSPTLYKNLSAGAKVIPHDEVMALAAYGVHKPLNSVKAGDGQKLDALLRATEENTSAVKALKMPNTAVHIHGGWDSYVRTNTNKNW